jgi:hypothetical protein
MRAELRPSSLGEILDRTAQMYRSRFLQYFGIAAVAYSGILVLSLIADVSVYSPAHRPSGHAGTAAFSLGVVLGAAIGLISILPIAVGMAAVMRAVARNYLGESCTIREAYQGVKRRWYRYILILLAIDLYAIFPVAFVVALVALSSFLLPAGVARSLIIGIAVLVGFAGIFYMIWRMLRWALSVPAAVMEDLTVHGALKRSSILTRGCVWRIFVMLLLVVAIMMVIQYVVEVPMFIMLWKSHGVPTLPARIFTAFAGFLSGSFLLPVYSIALTLFYYDQRIRKEGYDVEWLMEQAGLTAVPPSPLPGPVSPGTLIPETESPGPSI